MSTEVADQDNLPSFNYDLRTRFVSNLMFWSSIIMTATIIPIVLFYPLFYCATLSKGAILGIASISNALPNLYQLPFRFWKLWKKDRGDRRPLSGNIMDLFMYNYLIGSSFSLPFTSCPLQSQFRKSFVS